MDPHTVLEQSGLTGIAIDTGGVPIHYILIKVLSGGVGLAVGYQDIIKKEIM